MVKYDDGALWKELDLEPDMREIAGHLADGVATAVSGRSPAAARGFG